MALIPERIVLRIAAGRASIDSRLRTLDSLGKAFEFASWTGRDVQLVVERWWREQDERSTEQSNGNGATIEIERGIYGEKESRVIDALENPSWVFRTPAGIAHETGLSEDEVRRILRALPATVVRRVVPDKTGRELYAAASRKKTWRERYLEFRSRFAM